LFFGADIDPSSSLYCTLFPANSFSEIIILITEADGSENLRKNELSQGLSKLQPPGLNSEAEITVFRLVPKPPYLA